MNSSLREPGPKRPRVVKMAACRSVLARDDKPGAAVDELTSRFEMSGIHAVSLIRCRTTWRTSWNRQLGQRSTGHQAQTRSLPFIGKPVKASRRPPRGEALNFDRSFEGRLVD